MRRIMSLVLAMLLLAVGACAESTVNAGTYMGTGAGFGGDFTLTVTVDGQGVVAVEVGEHAETPSIGGAAMEKLGPMRSA